MLKNLKGLFGKCDIASGKHKGSRFNGECLDCGATVCSKCGLETGSVIRHISEAYCFASGRAAVSRTKYKKSFGIRNNESDR